MNRRNLLLGTTGLALGISGCSNSSNGPSSVPAKKVTLDDCPALKAYIDSLCDIPGGTFKMGSNEYDDESPVHRVPISAFRMGKTPVTVAMWEEYSDHTNVQMPPEPDAKLDAARKFNVGWIDKDHPIVNVSWDDCQGYANWASDISGLSLTLPSEARWEYACRGGKEGLEYPWGSEFDRSKLWCSDSRRGDRGSTGSVNRRVYVWLDHPWGLIDMVGNVYQWCEDWYDPKWYGIPQASERDVVNVDSSPSDPIAIYPGTDESKPCRCLRGGAWHDTTVPNFRCSNRMRFFSTVGFSYFGFRLVATSLS